MSALKAYACLILCLFPLLSYNNMTDISNTTTWTSSAAFRPSPSKAIKPTCSVLIVKRPKRLYELGDGPSAWANGLYTILRRFVSAFDGNPDTDFGSTSYTVIGRIAGRTTSAAG